MIFSKKYIICTWITVFFQQYILWRPSSQPSGVSYHNAVRIPMLVGVLKVGSQERDSSFYECSPILGLFKKSFTKCKFDKIDIIQYVLYIIRAIHCRYENGTLISIAILFRFLNNQPISQKNYVYMIIIPFYILSLVKIYIISNFFQVCIIRFFLQK